MQTGEKRTHRWIHWTVASVVSKGRVCAHAGGQWSAAVSGFLQWVGIGVVERKMINVERMHIHVYMGLVATYNSAHKIRDVL